MINYTRLIDAETWAFIHETERWYPPETASFTIAQQRDVYDRMCIAFRRPRPAGLTVVDEPFGGVACRRYEPRDAGATVLYLHGGGFVVGGLDSHDDICAEIAERAGRRVVSADYRLAPEHKHPAAFEDAFRAARSVAAACPGPLVLAGDSAGANLVAAVAHAARKSGPRIAGQVLIYPGLGGDRDAGSYLTHARAPMLTRDDILFYANVRFAAGEPKNDPTAVPLRDADMAGLPPTVIFAAECDPLHDDGPTYAARVNAAGGRAISVTERGLVHGYLRARHSVARARESFSRILSAIEALSRGAWPALDLSQGSAAATTCPPTDSDGAAPRSGKDAQAPFG